MKQGRGTRDEGRGIPRREFVGVVVAGAAGLAIHPYSLFPRASSRIERIGLQLYTVRDLVKQDFEGTLSQIGAIGYREVEFAGYFDHTPEQVRAALDHAGLKAPAAHVPFDAITTGWEALLHTANLIGHEYVVVAWIPEERRRTLDDWRRIGELLNRAATDAKKAGLGFAYHNHNFEFVPVENRLPYDLLLESTDAGLVKLELDLFWITFGGGDPLAYFARCPGRFPMVHVKDMTRKPTADVAPERVMVDVGKGSIDWKAIFARSQQAGIQHYFVEHDQPPDPLADIRVSYNYLHDLDF